MEPRTASSIEAGRRSVDAYYADILDIPAMRDDPDSTFSSTREQILRLQNPTDHIIGDPIVELGTHIDPFFNNSPYLRRYTESGLGKRNRQGDLMATDTRWDSNTAPEVSILELWAGEMRALSDKEMREGLSPREEELLRAYQDYFGGRTGMAEGGVVEPPFEQKGIFGLMGDVMRITTPPANVPITADRQAAVGNSANPDFPGRADFYDPGVATFGERLMYEYGYPGGYDPVTGRETFDMSPGGAQWKVVPEGRPDMPMPQELRDVRQHMLGTALAARGYGEGIAGFMGNVNEMFGLGKQTPADREMDRRNNAVGLDLFRQAGIQTTPQELTEMVDDAIFQQLDRIMARTPQEREGRRVSPGWEYNWRSPEGGPDVYFPRDERGGIATQY